MKMYSKYCPVYFDSMFGKENGEEYTEEEWGNLSLTDIMSSLTYELFYDSASGKEELLDLAETLPDEDKNVLFNILEPVRNKDYIRTWRGCGELPPRVLLYGAGAADNRVKDLEAYKDYSDLTYFLIKLKSLRVRFSKEQDGVVYVNSSVGGQLCHLKPCCPHCHTILPDKWFNSVGYLKVSMIAPPVGGKTTLLSSWMVNEYEAIRTMGLNSDCSAVYGFEKGDTEFEIQKYFRKAADNLLLRGEYPGRDEPTRKPPLYTRIIHYTDEVNPDTGVKEEYLLVGGYDIAGETLRSLQDGETSPELSAYLKHMDAYIYLISPSQLHGLSRFITDRKDAPLTEESGEGPVTLLPLMEQGHLQRSAEAEKGISAFSLLNAGTRSDNIPDPWYIFHKIDTLLIHSGKKHDAHMAYTLVKCDQIMDLPEIGNIANTDILFRTPSNAKAMDERYIFQNGEEVKKILTRYAMDGDEDQNKDFLRYLSNTDAKGGFRSVSWHCVSANVENSRSGRYQFIRKMDPLIGCLLSEFEKLGWS